MRTSYFVSRETVVPTRGDGMCAVARTAVRGDVAQRGQRGRVLQDPQQRGDRAGHARADLSAAGGPSGRHGRAELETSVANGIRPFGGCRPCCCSMRSGQRSIYAPCRFQKRIDGHATMRRALSCALLAVVAASSAGGRPGRLRLHVLTATSASGSSRTGWAPSTTATARARRSRRWAIGGTPIARWYTSAYAAWAADDGGRVRARRMVVDEPPAADHPRQTARSTSACCANCRARTIATEGRVGVSCGPTLQMDSDDLQVNVNPLLGKHIGAAEPEKPSQLGYQWQVKGMVVARRSSWARRASARSGPWNHWSHLRPVSKATRSAPRSSSRPTPPAARSSVDAAWLFGIGDGSTAQHSIRLRLEHEF